MTNGDVPYLGLSNITQLLETGTRLPQAGDCTDEIYELMQRCWKLKPEG